MAKIESVQADLKFTLPNPDICGFLWQIDYYRYFDEVEKHVEAMRPSERRYLFMGPTHTGPADNIFGFVSFFLFALLSKRAYHYIPFCETHNIAYNLEVAYKPRSFNWSHAPSFNISEDHLRCLYSPYNMYPTRPTCDDGAIQLYPFDATLSSIKTMLNINRPIEGMPNYSWKTGDIMNMSTWWPGQLNWKYEDNILITASNRGYTYSIFDNVLYNSTLRQMGLRPESTFSCLFNYLLEMKDEVCVENNACIMAESAIAEARKNDEVIISIQVRFDRNKNFDDHFKCGEEIAAEYNADGRNVTYILSTPFEHIQKHAKAKFGDKVVLPSWDIQGPTRVHESYDTDPGDAINKKTRMRAELESARDMWIMSLADHHIFDREAGFAVVAAMMRVRQPEEYLLHYYYEHPCSRNKPLDLRRIAYTWSGL